MYMYCVNYSSRLRKLLFEEKEFRERHDDGDRRDEHC
jgi:hypothetical protein